MANIGFIGLGIMGAPMAGHLLKAGHSVFTYTHGDTPAMLLEAGAQPCSGGSDTTSIGTSEISATRGRAKLKACISGTRKTCTGIFLSSST